MYYVHKKIIMFMWPSFEKKWFFVPIEHVTMVNQIDYRDKSCIFTHCVPSHLNCKTNLISIAVNLYLICSR